MLELDQLIPITLKDRPSLKHSDIWGVDRKLVSGSYVKLTAASGTGKTTLMHFLYGLRKDYTGAIVLEQATLNQQTAEQLSSIRSKQLSIVFQDLRLFPQLSLRENIELKRLLHDTTKTSEDISNMSEALGLTSVLDQPAAICSYGEQQRAAIIRALIAPFEWLLLDEPFSHLDAVNTKKAAALIDEVCSAQKAGLILADLDTDTHFNYTYTFQL